MDNNSFLLTDNELVIAEQSLLSASSKFKSSIFSLATKDIGYDRLNSKEYISYINQYISFWDDYANKLIVLVRNSESPSKVKSIPYEYVRKFLYSKYDYSSIILFVDGISQGVKDGKFTTKNDIEKFKQYTISKSFPNRDNEIGGLIEEVIENPRMGFCPPDDANYKKFESIKFVDIINKTDIMEISSSITKVVNYLIKNISQSNIMGVNTKMNLYSDNTPVQFATAIINNIVDYITYTLVVFSTRIYIYSSYAKPFITNSMTESVKDIDIDNEPINNLQMADDILCRDMEKINELQRILYDGIGHFGPYKNQNKSDNNNQMIVKLNGNRLFIFIARELSELFNNELMTDTESTISELDNILKNCMFNPKQGIEGNTSSKQELLHIISRSKPQNDTIDAYKKLYEDMVNCFNSVLRNIYTTCNSLKRISTLRSTKEADINLMNSISSSYKMLHDLYRELSSAILYRGRDIEMKINDMKNSRAEEIISNNIEVKIPGEKSDVDSIANNMMGVPDTTRMSLELLDIYSEPQLEYLDMYSKFIQQDPRFKNDRYFQLYQEEGDPSSVRNLIKSMISGIIKRLFQFFNNKYFLKAVEWVKQNQQKLMSANYDESKTLEVLDYKDINLNIGKNFNDKLRSFGENTISSTTNVDKFIRALYTVNNKSLYDLFNSKNIQDPQKLYTNFILFGIDPTTTKETEVKPIKITGADVKSKYMKQWIETVLGSKNIHDSLTREAKEIDKKITEISRKILQMTFKYDTADGKKLYPEYYKSNDQKNDNENKEGNNTTENNKIQESVLFEDTTTQNTTSSSTTSTENTSNNDSSSTNNSNNEKVPPALSPKDRHPDVIFMNKLSDAFVHIWGNLYYPVTKYLKDQYQYIQAAYAIIKE